MTPLAESNIYSSATLKLPMMQHVAPGSTESPLGQFKILGEPPHWLGPVVGRLAELARSPGDWDGRGSRALSAYDAQDALNFIGTVLQRAEMPVPWIGMLSSGGLQVSWSHGEVDVEVVFDSTRGERLALVADDQTEEELSIGQFLEQASDVAQRLYAADLAPV